MLRVTDYRVELIINLYVIYQVNGKENRHCVKVGNIYILGNSNGKFEVRSSGFCGTLILQSRLSCPKLPN